MFGSALPVWVAGDSIVAGLGTSHGSWPHRLGERLAGRALADQAVVNKGRGGSGVLLNLNGLEPLSTWLPAQLEAAEVAPQTVIVAAGFNDLVSVGDDLRPPSGSPDVSLSQAMYQLVGTLGGLGVPNVRVATITPFRAGVLPAGWIPALTRRRDAYNGWIRAMYSPTGQLLDIGDQLAGPDGLMAATYDSGDGLHPNDRGASVLAGAIDLTRIT
jgi:lysophospholipase L1-like esterase